MNMLKHILDERLRIYKHLPLLHAMELLVFPLQQQMWDTYYHVCRGNEPSRCAINRWI